MTKLFSRFWALCLTFLPYLLHVKFSFVGGAPCLTWPDLATVFSSYAATLAALLYWLELALRAFPTVQNYSLVNILHELLTVLVPNRAAGGGYFAHEPVIDGGPHNGPIVA